METPQDKILITEENFPQAWEWVDLHRRKAIIRKWVRKVSGTAGNLVYFLLMCLIMYGFYLQVDGVQFQAFLRKIPVFPQIWDWLLAHIFRPQLGTWGQLGVLAAILYITIFAVEALSSFLVRLCCRPKEKTLPVGTGKENAQQLMNEANRLVMSQRTAYSVSGVLSCILFLLLSIGLLAIFAIKAGVDQNEALIERLMPAMSSAPFFLLILCCWLGYALFAFPMLYMPRLLYVLKLPEDLLMQVERYYLQCDPEKKVQLEEEERILALAEEIKLRRIKEKALLLKK